MRILLYVFLLQAAIWNRSRPIDAIIFMIRTAFTGFPLSVLFDGLPNFYFDSLEKNTNCSELRRKSNIFFSCCNFIHASTTHNALVAAAFIDYKKKEEWMNKITIEQAPRARKNSTKFRIDTKVRGYDSSNIFRWVYECRVEWVLSVLESSILCPTMRVYVFCVHSIPLRFLHQQNIAWNTYIQIHAGSIGRQVVIVIGCTIIPIQIGWEKPFAKTHKYTHTHIRSIACFHQTENQLNKRRSTLHFVWFAHDLICSYEWISGLCQFVKT